MRCGLLLAVALLSAVALAVLVAVVLGDVEVNATRHMAMAPLRPVASSAMANGCSIPARSKWCGASSGG